MTGTGTSSTITDDLFGIRVANLTGNPHFQRQRLDRVRLADRRPGIGTVMASKNANFILTNSSLQTSDGMSLTLNGITDRHPDRYGQRQHHGPSVTGPGPDRSPIRRVSLAWLLEDSSVTLTDSLVTAGPMSLALSGFITADLTEEADGNPSPGADTFNVSGWTHQGFLEGYNVVSVTATESADITLTNTSQADPDSFIDVRHHVDDIEPHPDRRPDRDCRDRPSLLDHRCQCLFRDNEPHRRRGRRCDPLRRRRHGTLTATGSGNGVLIGEASDTTLTDTGAGRNILIGGGAGGDNLVGNGNDILVSGTTAYDSDTSANLTALDAILAEWSSSNSYAMRIKKIKRGVGPDHQDAFNSSSIHIDSNANTLSDRHFCSSRPKATPMLSRTREPSFPSRPIPIPQLQSNNWFIVSRHDHVTRRSNETETII